MVQRILQRITSFPSEHFQLQLVELHDCNCFLLSTDSYTAPSFLLTHSWHQRPRFLHLFRFRSHCHFVAQRNYKIEEIETGSRPVASFLLLLLLPSLENCGNGRLNVRRQQEMLRKSLHESLSYLCVDHIRRRPGDWLWSYLPCYHLE